MQDSESNWIHRTQSGDPEAFTYLVERYQQPVFNLCYRMLNDPRDVEDAAQETFLRAYKNIRRYDSSRPFPTWLLSIAAHYCIDQIRKRSMNIISMEELPQPDFTDDAPSPEVSVSRDEEQKLVQSLLSALNPTDRAAVVMYYWNDFAYDEIALTLSLSLSAVKSRLHRARRAMAEQWSAQYPTALGVERKRHESPAF